MKWRQLVLILAAVGGTCAVCRGQLEVDLTLDQSVYIVGEPIRADVTIANHFPTPFGIGPGIDYRRNNLTFEIKDNARDTLPSKHPDAAMIANLMLAGGESHAAAFELDEWYAMSRTGSYIVRAVVRRDDRIYTSPARAINIVPGLEVASAVQFFGDRPDIQRKLSLVYYMRRQAEFLFLRCTDTPGDRIWMTLELGRLVRTTPPTLSIAPGGEVTIVHRATQDAFLRTRVRSTVDGVTLLAQEQGIDPQTLETARAQAAARESMDARKNAAKKHWWQFGGSSDADKNP
jgi:hypothetical protein